MKPDYTTQWKTLGGIKSSLTEIAATVAYSLIIKQKLYIGIRPVLLVRYFFAVSQPTGINFGIRTVWILDSQKMHTKLINTGLNPDVQWRIKSFKMRLFWKNSKFQLPSVIMA